MLESRVARWIQRGSVKCLAVADASGTPELYHQSAIFARSQSQQLTSGAVERTLRCRGGHKLIYGTMPIDSYDPNLTRVELI